MESPSPACLDGGFFFPSSPLFGAQQHHNQLDSPHSGSSASDADAAEHDFVADMLFVQQQPVMHLQQQHQHQHKSNAAGQFHNQLMTEPQQYQQHQQHQHFDWHQASESALPIQLPSLHHLEQQQQLPHPPQLPHDVHSYSSGRSSSGSSGHSTPTLVASTSPTHDQVQQQYPQHHPQHEHSSSTASVSSGASASSSAPPSLLDQLSCTIPAASMDGLFASGTSGSATKPKRKSAKTEKAPSANGSVATLSPQPSQQQHHLQQQHQHHHSLPVFVGAPAPLHMDSLSVPHHLTVPMHSSSSYASSPSSLSPRAYSPCPSSNSPNSSSGMLVENNEPHPLDDEETKKRKLARKAELARLSRKRKKTRLTDLEAEVRRLEDELARAKKSRFDRDQATAAAEAGAAASSSAATDSLSKHKMSQVISAMSAAVHSGLARCTSANTPTNQRGPVLTGSDASRGQPSALTPLIEEFMVQYNSQAANCSQHLATLQEHHLKPLRTFDFLAALMKQPHDVSSNKHGTASTRDAFVFFLVSFFSPFSHAREGLWISSARVTPPLR